MADWKQPSLRGQIRIPKDLDRQIEQEAARLDVTKYGLVEMMWRAYEHATMGENAEGHHSKGESSKSSLNLVDLGNVIGSTIRVQGRTVREWVQLLAVVLASPDRTLVDAITSHLSFAAKVVGSELLNLGGTAGAKGAAGAVQQTPDKELSPQGEGFRRRLEGVLGTPSQRDAADSSNKAEDETPRRGRRDPKRMGRKHG